MKPYVVGCLLLSLLVSGCRDECYPGENPELKVTSINNFTRVYGLPTGADVPRRDGVYYLPLSLSADSVTYVFEAADSTDTLTVFYARRFFFESERCGFVAGIEADSTRPENVRTTFNGAFVQFTETSWGGRSNVYEVSIYE